MQKPQVILKQTIPTCILTVRNIKVTRLHSIFECYKYESMEGQQRHIKYQITYKIIKIMDMFLIYRGDIVRGVLSRGGYCPGGYCPGGYCPGVLSGGMLSGGGIVWEDIALIPNGEMVVYICYNYGQQLQ